VILCAIGIGFLLLPIFADDYLIGVATRILILAIAAVSLDLILGYGGMVSFGHACFLGIGAYSVAIWSVQGVDHVWLHLGTALVSSALIGLVIGALSIRTGGLYFIMITFAFAQMFFYLGLSFEFLGGDDGVSIKSSTIGGVELMKKMSADSSAGPGTTLYFLTFAALVLALIFIRILVNSRFGFVLRGCRSNEPRMQAIGFPTYRYRLAAFVIAAMICGFAGALLANQQLFVSPSYMSWLRSGELLVMVVLGGLGTVFGPALGAVSLLVLEEFLIAYAGKDYWMIILGPILVTVAVFARQGLLSFIPSEWRAFPSFLARATLLSLLVIAYLWLFNYLPKNFGFSPLALVLWPLAILAAWIFFRRQRESVKGRSHD
jgi:branched-chain amino acid transport system permease protein